MDLSFKSVPTADYKIGSIVVLKLTAGDEVIGRITEEDNDRIVLERPFRVDLVPSETNPGAMAIGFLPFLLAIQKIDVVTVFKNQVVALINNIPTATERYYLEQSTGLDLKSKPSQILNG